MESIQVGQRRSFSMRSIIVMGLLFNETGKIDHVKILGVTIFYLIRYDKATRTWKGRGI